MFVLIIIKNRILFCKFNLIGFSLLFVTIYQNSKYVHKGVNNENGVDIIEPVKSSKAPLLQYAMLSNFI